MSKWASEHASTVRTNWRIHDWTATLTTSWLMMPTPTDWLKRQRQSQIQRQCPLVSNFLIGPWFNKSGKICPYFSGVLLTWNEFAWKDVLNKKHCLLLSTSQWTVARVFWQLGMQCGIATIAYFMVWMGLSHTVNIASLSFSQAILFPSMSNLS